MEKGFVVRQVVTESSGEAHRKHEKRVPAHGCYTDDPALSVNGPPFALPL